MTDFFSRLFGRSAGSSGKQGLPTPAKRPPSTDAEKLALESAGAWLTAQSIAHTRAFALGEERRFDFNQNSGALTLRFADGARLTLEGQILASFQPRNRSLRWAWANRHVDSAIGRAARAAKDHPDTGAFAAFQTPMFEVKFEDACRLVGLAAKISGCDGVYRCLTDDSLTVFVGYRAVSLASENAQPSPHEEKAAIAHVEAWHAAMLPFDREYRALGRNADEGAFKRLQAGQLAAYHRFWRRDDDYWEPCSFGWPSDHDPAETLLRFATPRRAGGVYVVSRNRTLGGTRAHVVTFIEGQPFITDQDIDWGAGVLLDGAP